jgi:pentachlorophenol monooxygenase/3-(3-hydroxy-phenyl)propionate hydroxylase
VILPDVPVQVAGADRLRQLARSGFLVLASDDVDVAALSATVEKATDAPASVYTLSSLDPSGVLASALAAAPGEVRLVRPDAHVAAIVPADDPRHLSDAIQRSVGSAVAAPAS